MKNELAENAGANCKWKVVALGFCDYFWLL